VVFVVIGATVIILNIHLETLLRKRYVFVLATEEFLCCAPIQVVVAILFIVSHLLKLNARQKNIN
jgi:hypothetical protein